MLFLGFPTIHLRTPRIYKTLFKSCSSICLYSSVTPLHFFNSFNLKNTKFNNSLSKQKMSSMNVLVYSGPGTTKNCVEQCVKTFRLLFTPYYSVSTADERMLENQPWELKTALLVIPGGADLPMCKTFRGKINDRIKSYVSKGGKYIGICAGGYYSSSRCEFELGNPTMEVSGPRDLKFFPGPCRGSVVKGFDYGTEKGTRALEISVNLNELPNIAPKVPVYVNGGGLFVDAHKYRNVKILATYPDDIDVNDNVGGSNAAAVLCEVGRGKALLFGCHPEFDPDTLDDNSEVPSFAQVLKTLKATNNSRIDFLRSSLKKLELKVNEKETHMPNLTPLFLCSIDGASGGNLIKSLESEIGYQIQNVMDVGSDKFAINKSMNYVHETENVRAVEDPSLAIKQIFLCENETPDKYLTPNFDIEKFKRCLTEFYELSNQKMNENSVGNTFMYGEVLTSTSGLMDSNFKFLPLIPDGFTITGTIQLLGKGRSGNHWVNPKGVLPVSFLLKIPQSITANSPVVFIQYLGSMAYTQAILEYGEGYDELPVKIKWPNDIYIKYPKYVGENIDKDSKEVTHTKIGGILVNTNVFNGVFYLVLGAGVNVSNEAPTTSINSVIDAMNEYYAKIGKNKRLSHLEEEKLLAKFLTIFNQMFTKFKVDGFTPFLKDYYKMWFHSNQIVTLSHKNGAKAQVCGITPDWGMLMAKDLKTGTIYELQPDGNSFDMFNGLISQKR